MSEQNKPIYGFILELSICGMTPHETSILIDHAKRTVLEMISKSDAKPGDSMGIGLDRGSAGEITLVSRIGVTNTKDFKRLFIET